MFPYDDYVQPDVQIWDALVRQNFALTDDNQ